MRVIVAGFAAGAVISFANWWGQPGVDSLSVFPDGLSLLTLVLALFLAVFLLKRYSPPLTRRAFLRSGILASAMAGVVFGLYNVAATYLHFESPSWLFYVFGFAVAFVSCLVVGTGITLLLQRVPAAQSRTETA